MIHTRELETIDEMEEVYTLETRIWKSDIVPTHQTLTTIKNGGIMIGAYESEKLVGFSYGFPGFMKGKSYLCSHMLGVDEAYRSQGIGEILKQMQRAIAMKKGYELIQWTFDPLETRNAYLNLTKLNGICSIYVENAYGEMQDGLNKGLPTDRFEVYWYLNSPYVTEKQLPSLENPSALNRISFNEADLPVFIAEGEQALTNRVYTISVPKDIQGLKAANPVLALDWRLQTRSLFQKLFGQGYAAVRLKPYENYAVYFFVKKQSLELGGKQ